MENEQYLENSKKNSFQRLIGVIFSPVNTMDDIAKKPNFIVPILLSIIITVIFSIVTFDEIYKISVKSVENSFATMEDKGVELTDKQKDSQLSITKIMTKVSVGLVPLFTVLSFLISAGICMLVLKVILKGNGTFKQYFSILSYAYIISVLGVLVKIGAYFATKDYNTIMYISSLRGFLPNNKDQNTINTLASSFDFFSIWYYIVAGIGLKSVSKLSTKAITLFIGIIFILITGFSVASVLLAQMFS